MQTEKLLQGQKRKEKQAADNGKARTHGVYVVKAKHSSIVILNKMLALLPLLTHTFSLILPPVVALLFASHTLVVRSHYALCQFKTQ